ncbi:MAG: hypothetical protein AB1750_14695, partial [Chloroflexota bacterium]
GLDLTSYAGILAGSQRESAEQAKGADVLGGGDWEASLLYQTFMLAEVPLGHPTADQANGLIVYAGSPVPPPTATPLPTSPALPTETPFPTATLETTATP